MKKFGFVLAIAVLWGSYPAAFAAKETTAVLSDTSVQKAPPVPAGGTLRFRREYRRLKVFPRIIQVAEIPFSELEVALRMGWLPIEKFTYWHALKRVGDRGGPEASAGEEMMTGGGSAIISHGPEELEALTKEIESLTAHPLLHWEIYRPELYRAIFSSAPQTVVFEERAFRGRFQFELSAFTERGQTIISKSFLETDRLVVLPNNGSTHYSVLGTTDGCRPILASLGTEGKQ